jgi:hypothetical protein
MSNRPKLTAMMESARRVTAVVPAWMLDSKRAEATPGDMSREPSRDHAELREREQR